MGILKVLRYYSSELTLLVVDDDKELVNNLIETLKVFFKTVYFAYDGVEAFEKYKQIRPDIVITDITMPNMNGIDLARKIKVINPEQVVMILSAHSDTRYMIELIDINVDQFIIKPFDKNTLLFKLIKVSEKVIYKKGFNKFYEKKLKIDSKSIKSEVIDTEKESNSPSENTIDLESEKSKDLNKNYHFSHDRETAVSFMNDIESDNLLWRAFKDDIPELMQLNDDFAENMDMVDLEGFDEGIRNNIVQILSGYILIFSSLEQMLRMTEVLGTLKDFLEELDVASLNSEQQQKLKLLSFINEDISRFLHTVFVYKDTVDIYYLEDSLESSILKMKNSVLGIEEEDDDELELF